MISLADVLLLLGPRPIRDRVTRHQMKLAPVPTGPKPALGERR